MPNPKTQTVTFEIKAALDELKKGRVEYRSDKTGVVHFSIGKVINGAGQVVENVHAVLGEIAKKRPADAKGEFINGIRLVYDGPGGESLPGTGEGAGGVKMAEYVTRVNNEKTDAVNRLKAEFSGIQDYIFTNYRGLTVAQITELRNKLRGRTQCGWSKTALPKSP